MRNRGFGFAQMFIFMGIFIFFLLIVSFIVHGIDLDNRYSSPAIVDTPEVEEKDFDYSSIEKQLKTVASLYQRDIYPSYNKSEPLYVDAEKLIALDYLSVLTDGEVVCDGYARITYDNVIHVVPYIKCGTYYVTEGYSIDEIE